MSDRLQDIAAFPADRAWFCGHCETVANRQICPYCLGNGFPLSAWLNRSVKDDVLDPRAQAEMLHSAAIAPCAVSDVLEDSAELTRN